MKSSRHAPAVHYPLKRDAVLGRVLATGWLFSAVLLLVWYQVQDLSQTWRHAVWCAAWLWLVLAAWCLARSYRRLPVGWLVWTGKCWRIEQEGRHSPRAGHALHDAEGHCRLVLDLHRGMLLQFANTRPTGPRIWIWVSRRHAQAPAHWHALRCVVHDRSADGASRSMPGAAA